MNKTKFKFVLALLATTATALSGCGKKDEPEEEPDINGPVSFWSSFGGTYSNVLQTVCDDIQDAKSITINHTSKGSYDEIKRELDANIALGPDYCPDIAQGYPDHFAVYLGNDAIKPIEKYFTDEELADYYEEYMDENKFYDNNGRKAQEHIYGIPFNKSTELLGYNGVFVDYCKSVQASYGYTGLENIPATWDEWAVQGPKYNQIFKDIMMTYYTEDNVEKTHRGKYIFGTQNAEGEASGFVEYDWQTNPETVTKPNGDVVLKSDETKVLLLDMSQVDPKKSVLMSWDATDNAFITLVRQWRAKYTQVNDSENTKIAKKRVGQVLFNSNDEQSKVIECMKFFHGLNKDRIFGIPKTLGGSYSSDAFALCRVMFMICSSGGLSYNTANWHHRFRVAPIPYKYADNKTVISQGANICLLNNKFNYKNSTKIIKALTSGEFQTQWCLETGYYPCSKSAVNHPDYQAFLQETTYDSATRVAYREGSKLNTNYYMNDPEYVPANQKWIKFVDPAFKGSSVLRDAVKGVLESVFSILDANPTDAKIKKVLDDVEQIPTIVGEGTIQFIH